MKVVKFNRTHLMYQRGETAGFPEDHANKLIAAGIARDPNAPKIETLPDGDDVLPEGGAGGGEGGERGEPSGAKTEKAGAAVTKEDGGPASTEPGAPPAQGKSRK